MFVYLVTRRNSERCRLCEFVSLLVCGRGSWLWLRFLSRFLFLFVYLVTRCDSGFGVEENDQTFTDSMRESSTIKSILVIGLQFLTLCGVCRALSPVLRIVLSPVLLFVQANS